jgi:ABC-type multidrug transport system fused ATPase/permease subunit
MKRFQIGTVIVVLVLLAGLVVAQQQEQMRQRFQQQREAQQKALATLQEQTGKLKTLMEQSAASMQNRQNFQDMSEEERTKMRDEFTKRREEQQQIIQSIEQQVMILKGGRQMATEHNEAMKELNEIKDLATEEKAAKAAERLGQYIEKKQKAYEDLRTKLGLPAQQPRPQQ